MQNDPEGNKQKTPTDAKWPNKVTKKKNHIEKQTDYTEMTERLKTATMTQKGHKQKRNDHEEVKHVYKEMQKGNKQPESKHLCCSFLFIWRKKRLRWIPAWCRTVLWSLQTAESCLLSLSLHLWSGWTTSWDSQSSPAVCKSALFEKNTSY